VVNVEKRYCDSAGISMGRAIVALIDRELTSVLGDRSGDEAPVFAHRAEEELASREAEVAARERELKSVEERIRSRSEDLRGWEAGLEARERQVEQAMKLTAQPREVAPKVGRNERCPCESGLKYKYCHGLVAAATGWFPKPFRICGVLVVWPGALVNAI
jgi:chromosome segregation ATPase